MTPVTAPMRVNTVPTLKMSSIVKTESVEFKAQPERDSKYEDIYAQMEKLKPGQSFMINIPKGVAPRTMHNRLNAAIHRVDVAVPKGCVFVKRTTEDNRIAICCRKIK